MMSASTLRNSSTELLWEKIASLSPSQTPTLRLSKSPTARHTTV